MNFKSEKINSRGIVLDTLRIFACIWVLAFHWAGGTDSRFITPQIPKLYFDKPLESAFFSCGYLGVDLFFIISGAVIFHSASGKNSYDFLKSRFIRLFPAYIFTLIPTIIIYRFYSNPKVSIYDIFNSILFAQNSYESTIVVGAAWTLYIEILFYLTIFLIKFFTEILQNLGEIYSSVNLQNVIIWMIVSFWALGKNNFILLPNILIPKEYLGYFLMGCSIPIMHKIKSKFVSILLYFNAILLLKYTLFPRIAYLNIYGFSQARLILYIYIFFIVIFSIACLGFNLRIKRHSILKIIEFSAISTYPIYLLHGQVSAFIATLFYKKYSETQSYAFTFLILIIVTVIFTSKIEPKMKNYLKRNLSLAADG